MEGTPHFSNNKKAIVAGILVVSLSVAAFLVIQPALAQQLLMPSYSRVAAQQTTSNSSSTIIKGSVSLQNATNDFVKNNVKIPFATGANTAQSQVSNGVVVGGKLAEVQGYLVYVFNVADYNDGTLRVVIVDAGNGSVLYTSQAMTLYYGWINGGYGGEYKRHHHHEGYGENENDEHNGTTTAPYGNTMNGSNL